MTHTIRLKRDPHDREKTKCSAQLGEILKHKASEGVQVLVGFYLISEGLQVLVGFYLISEN